MNCLLNFPPGTTSAGAHGRRSRARVKARAKQLLDFCSFFEFLSEFIFEFLLEFLFVFLFELLGEFLFGFLGKFLFETLKVLVITFETLKVFAVFLKSLVSVSDTFKALQACAEFLKSLTFVSDFFGTSVLFSIIYPSRSRRVRQAPHLCI